MRVYIMPYFLLKKNRFLFILPILIISFQWKLPRKSATSGYFSEPRWLWIFGVESLRGGRPVQICWTLFYEG
jgi:hypothetical protein